MKLIESAKSKKKKRKNKKKKNKEFIVQYWSLLEPKPYAELMVANSVIKDFYKQSSSLQEVKFKGELKQDDSGYVYVKVKDEVVHGLFSLIDKEEKAQKPPYFGKGKTGAHISVISDEEGEELKDTTIKEVGQDIEFELQNVYKTNPDGWDEMDMVWFVTVESPELPKIRKRYGLPATYDGKGHEFHCTIGVREKSGK